MIAALAYLVSEQGHGAGLTTTEGDRFVYLPPRSGRVHLRSLIARIDRLSPSGAWDPSRAIARGAQLLQRRGVIVVASDFYDAEADTRRELRRAVQRGHDVAMLQVLSPDERTLTGAGHIELEDLESGERRVIDDGAAARYDRAMSDFLARCRREALRDGVDYALLPTDVAPEVALRGYLLRRSRGTDATHGEAARA